MKKKKKNSDEDIFTELAPRLIQSSSCDVHGYVVICRTLSVTSRPLIAQHRSHDHFPGISLVTAPGVKIEWIHTSVFLWMH